MSHLYLSKLISFGSYTDLYEVLDNLETNEVTGTFEDLDQLAKLNFRFKNTKIKRINIEVKSGIGEDHPEIKTKYDILRKSYLKELNGCLYSSVVSNNQPISILQYKINQLIIDKVTVNMCFRPGINPISMEVFQDMNIHLMIIHKFHLSPMLPNANIKLLVKTYDGETEINKLEKSKHVIYVCPEITTLEPNHIIEPNIKFIENKGIHLIYNEIKNGLLTEKLIHPKHLDRTELLDPFKFKILSSILTCLKKINSLF